MNAPLTKEQWEDVRRQSQSAVLSLYDPDKALLLYQQRGFGLLNSAGTNVLVIEKSRRIGFTWGLASYAALKAARAREAGGSDVLYISYAQEMTREFIEDVAMWAGAYSLAAAESEEFIFEDRKLGQETQSIQAFRIRFDSGFEVVALSSAPRSLRGKQGVVIIDEAAFVDNLDELLKAALALLIWGGQVVVCSTHDGTENPFNQLVQDVLAGRKPYKHMVVDFDQALEQGLYRRICEVQGIDWTPEGEAEWRDQIIAQYGDGADEELYCIPTQGSGSWLPAVLVEAAQVEPPETILNLELPADYLQRPELERKALFYPFLEELEAFLETLPRDLLYGLGFDFARTGDLSLLSLLSIEKNLSRRTRLMVEMRRVPYAEQKEVCRKVISTMLGCMAAAAFDASGNGAEVAETMAREFGECLEPDDGGLVHQIKFSREWYRVNMPPVKSAFEDGSMTLPISLEVLADFRLVKVIRGVPSVPDERTGEKGRKRHGDAAIGTALAYYATRQQSHQYGYQAVTTTAAPANDSRRFDDPDAGVPVGRQASEYRQPLGARIRGGVM